ncbi:rRNA maturation RNase YbeY [Patescibacteria group bacterium]|nr:rRNA maturation RNase YbeY [Patescibacteria group bacterium]
MPLRFLIHDIDRDKIGISALTLLQTGYDEIIPVTGEVEIQCVGLDKMRQLNSRYRSKDEPTDVLSFPTLARIEKQIDPEPAQPILLGGVVICPAKAVEYGETLPQLVHHGVLHLLGYDHERDWPEWAAAEAKVVRKLARHGLSIPPVSHESFQLP